MKRGSGAKSAIIVLASALLMVSLLMLAYGVLLRSNQHPIITLPDSLHSGEKAQEPEQPVREQIVSLRPDNVLAALQTVQTPESYYESLYISNFWSGGGSTKMVERYCAMGLQRINVRSSGITRCYLSDGETLYLWYDGDRYAVSRSLNEDISLLDLAGIPDYLGELSASRILAASFQGADKSDPDRILVEAVAEDGAKREYLVRLDSARLLHVDVTEEQELVYQLQQLELEQVAPTDELFRGVFELPDGTDPFGINQENDGAYTE
ncbi:MAG: hypothetical protein IKE00_04190 [Oscillospiraceae bacterium]|nr:hypothetical protein [Oscillospiraceae bacterium]